MSPAATVTVAPALARRQGGRPRFLASLVRSNGGGRPLLASAAAANQDQKLKISQKL